MRKIVKILQVQEWQKNGITHHKTLARLDNQEDASGYGKDFKVGDLVEAFWDDKHSVYKMQRSNPMLDKLPRTE